MIAGSTCDDGTPNPAHERNRFEMLPRLHAACEQTGSQRRYRRRADGGDGGGVEERAQLSGLAVGEDEERMMKKTALQVGERPLHDRDAFTHR